MANNTLKEELSKLSNSQLSDIINTQQAKKQSKASELESQILELIAKNFELKKEHQKVLDKLKKAHEEIAELRYQLNYHLNEKYGKSSDSIDDEDPTFDESDDSEESNTDKQDTKKITVKFHTRNVTNNPKSLPDDLLGINMKNFKSLIKKFYKGKNSAYFGHFDFSDNRYLFTSLCNIFMLIFTSFNLANASKQIDTAIYKFERNVSAIPLV